MPENSTYTEIFNKSHSQSLINFALGEWHFVQRFKEFPRRSGVYAVYSGLTQECLYVGQALDLYHRGLRHWVLKKAIDNQEMPSAAYKIIEYDNQEKTRHELLYNECLLIGLLKPLWNIGTPSPKPYSLPNRINTRNVKTVHWTQLIEDVCYQTFHKAMLSNEGYLVPKIIELPAKTGNMYKTWANVLYDKKYVQKWLEITFGKVEASKILPLLS